MPDRIVREKILGSELVNQLSWAAEVFYRRLMSKADDFGRYDGRIAVLRAELFTLRLNKVSESDIVKWMGECSDTGLVRCYQVDGKDYLEIQQFGQRLRAMKSKWPAPDSGCCQPSAGRGHMPPEEKEKQNPNTEVETEGEEEVPPHIEKEILEHIKKETKEFSPGAEKWNTRPGDEEMNLELPAIKVGSVIELFRITKNTTITEEQVIGLWSIFKSQNFMGEKFYQSPKEAVKHFINWSKGQNIEKVKTNGTDRNAHQRNFAKAAGGKEIGAGNILGSLRETGIL